MCTSSRLGCGKATDFNLGPEKRQLNQRKRKNKPKHLKSTAYNEESAWNWAPPNPQQQRPWHTKDDLGVTNSNPKCSSNELKAITWNPKSSSLKTQFYLIIKWSWINGLIKSGIDEIKMWK